MSQGWTKQDFKIAFSLFILMFCGFLCNYPERKIKIHFLVAIEKRIEMTFYKIDWSNTINIYWSMVWCRYNNEYIHMNLQHSFYWTDCWSNRFINKAFNETSCLCDAFNWTIEHIFWNYTDKLPTGQNVLIRTYCCRFFIILLSIV